MNQKNAEKAAEAWRQDLPGATIDVEDRYGDGVCCVTVCSTDIFGDYTVRRIYGPDEEEALLTQYPEIKARRELFAALRKAAKKLITGDKERATTLAHEIQALLEAEEDAYRIPCPGNAERPECSNRILRTDKQGVCTTCWWAAEEVERRKIGMECVSCSRSITWKRSEAAGHAVRCEKCEAADKPVPERYRPFLPKATEKGWDADYDAAVVKDGPVVLVPEVSE